MVENLESVRITKSYESIVRQVVTLISRGIWQPGQRLPAEREMVQQLGVGRTTVREALRALEALGMVETRPGEGTFVSQEKRLIIPNEIVDGLVADSSSLLELFEVRSLLEPQAAFLAAERRTDEQMDELTAIYRRLEAAIGNLDEFAKEDINFHRTLAGMAGNELLAEFERVILRALRRHLIESLKMPARMPSTFREHSEIYQAVLNKDSARARNAVLGHLNSAQDHTLARYSERMGSRASDASATMRETA